MKKREPVAQMLATTNEKRRFKLIGQWIAADPDIALAESVRLLVEDDPLARTLGADGLGQLVQFHRDWAPQIVDVLIPRLASEDNADALQAVISAVGHAEDERARVGVMAHSHHPDVEVRFSVAWALPSLGLDETALAVLRELSRDADEDVRDWATFGLAESDARDEATIEALAARTEDDHYDTRCEAILGLATRHDPPARGLVDRALARPMVGELIREARAALDA